MQVLDVVNDCLATLGETPLSSLADSHAYKGAAQTALDNASRRIQSKGWWFNSEQLELAPSPATGHVTLPGDALAFRSGTRDPRTLVFVQAKPWLVERGSRIYNTQTRSFVQTENISGEVIRLVPFEDLPTTASDYIAAEAVLRFQSNFDGDSNRRAELTTQHKDAKVACMSENIRQLKVSAYDNNPRLSRIKNATWRLA